MVEAAEVTSRGGFLTGEKTKPMKLADRPINVHRPKIGDGRIQPASPEVVSSQEVSSSSVGILGL